ncbi:MAG: CHRD domain-containing protein [Fibrobacteria bacterium]
MKVLRATLLAAGLLALAPEISHGGLLLSAWLDGNQEGLDSVKAKGVVGIKLNDRMDSAQVYGAFTNLSGPITSAHFHPGVRGINGPPAITITGWLKGNSIATTWAPIARSTVDSLLRGLFYLNIHTAAHPNGEIRGQVELERDLQFTAEIKGRFEKDSVTTAAEGIGYFQLSADDSTLSTWVVYRYPADDEADTLTMAHFHVGSKGANGAVAIDLTPDTSAGFMVARKSLVSPMNGITSAAFLDSLKAGSVYINFHSKKHAGGLMRGQLTATRERIFPSVLKDNAAGTQRQGVAITWLSNDTKKLIVRASYSGMTGSITAAHFHKATPVVVPIDSSTISATGIAAEIPLDAVSTAGFNEEGFIADLMMGDIYLNVHTVANPGGEISGALKLPVRTGWAFSLEGAQETPAVTTRAFGAGVVSMDPDSLNVRYAVVADSLDSLFTAAHFHRQAAGAAGGLVFDIGKTFNMNIDSMTGLWATGWWTPRNSPNPFTKVLSSSLLADSLYINIHTARNPAGAIRGQIKDRQGIAVAIFGKIPKAQAGFATLVPMSGGKAIGFLGEAGRTLTVRVVSMNGKILEEKSLKLNAAGSSDAIELNGLRQGLYGVIWEDKGLQGSAKFLRR